MKYSETNPFGKLLNQRHLAEKFANIQVEEGVFRGLETTRITSVFVPLHYEAKYAYPLVVWFHTPGMNESQLLRVMPMISLRNYTAVAMRGTPRLLSRGSSANGYYWDAESYDTCYTATMEMIEAVQKRYSIARNRVFLVGSEMGGTMALRMAFRNPSFFSGVASLDGAIPEDTALLEKLKEVRKLKFLFAVSRHSQTCPVERLCPHLQLLHSAGLCVTLRNYPTAGSLQTDMLRDVDRWIMGTIDTALM
ncbi:MAG: alpha/beta hydrolase-fold protein [Planctomycetia bacterium]|nr:alpha/beta hydrolase-fold protein [Planctomycetia bacterium]